MVERLKAAIARARAERSGREDPGDVRPAQPATPRAGSGRDEYWRRMPVLDVDLDHLASMRIVTATKSDPAHVPFDLLRTRLLNTLKENGWRRVGITSPTQACGKTTLAANLGFSLARRLDVQTILLDLDLRKPALAKLLGAEEDRPIRWLLEGTARPEKYLQRLSDSMAVGLNTRRERDATELILSTETRTALDELMERLAPDVLLCDIGPALLGDEAVAAMQHLDAVLVIAAGGITRASEIEEVEALVAEQTNLLGVVLNMAEDAAEQPYYYYGDYSASGG